MLSLESVTKFAKTLAVTVLLVASFLVVSASADSKARIVRLSEVRGTVQLDRAAGDGFEKAFINLPVVEGSKLKTGKDGRAEVEFEDGSALRLAPGSELDFARLSLGNDGQKITTVQLASGTAYGNLHPKTSHDKKNKGQENTGDAFLLNFGQQSLSVSDAAHFRVDLPSNGKPTIAVFKGKVTASSPAGQVEIAEKHSATISDQANSKEPFEIAKNYQEEPSDAWDHQQTDYHDRYAASGGSSSMNSPYSYGMSDLNYYGSFMSLPGYGNVWQPYFIGAGWSPFQDGAWAFYPGSGYMWVSGYPWGWMPYNYGNWAFLPGYGWVWQPGYFNTYAGIPRIVNPPARTKLLTPPATGHQTILVGRGLTANPTLQASRHLTINPNSAGFGVPRGSVHHLDRVAKSMSQSQTPHPVTVATAPPPSPASTRNTSMGAASPSMRGGSSTGMSTMGAPHRSSAPAPRSHP